MVKNMLSVKAADQLERIAQELAAQTTLGREWADHLIAWLSGSTTEEAEKLAQAIRTAKTKIPPNQ